MFTTAPRLLHRSFCSSARKFIEKPSGGATVKRTRKKLSELPQTLLLPSGQPAAPLEEWNGGLEGRKKTRTKLKEDDKPLKQPRASRKPPTIPHQGEESAHPKTDLALEIRQNLQKFPHCILLTRVGQFYESYFEQAPEVSRSLNIKLTSKSWGGSRVPMTGFPLMQLDRHLRTLVQTLQRCVALCEEFKLSEGKFERRVTRILTPGTLMDESFLNPYENTFLLSIGVSGNNEVGLAWMDVSTGEFFSQTSTMESLRDDLVRIGPKEVVLDHLLKEQQQHPVQVAIQEEISAFISYVTPTGESAPLTGATEANSDNITPSTRIPLTSVESLSISQITTHLKNNLLEHMPVFSQPLNQQAETHMQIDSHTIKSLEIREGMREGGTTGTLLSTIKRTITSSGTRLLARWICSPSTSIEEISTRQDLVEFFLTRPHLRADIISLLRKIEDTARIVQRFLAGKGVPGDLSDIADAVTSWEELRDRLNLERDMDLKEKGSLADWPCMDVLLGRMTSLKHLSLKIASAVERNEYGEDLEDEPSETDPFLALPTRAASIAPYKWKIKSQFSPQLTVLHDKLAKLHRQKEDLEIEYRNKYRASSLTLKASAHLGLHVHLKTKKDSGAISSDPDFVLLSQSGSTKTFFNQKWFALGTLISDTVDAIVLEERRSFHSLREEVNLQAVSLRKNARIIDEIDVTIGFAELAADNNLVRPIMSEERGYHVVNGRHPTVEHGLITSGRNFVPNTISLDDHSRICIITGPNMAGKSTLLRQTALIAILAQTGSFVPADSAKLGIIDKLFSRVGAKDDVFRDRSTFMVEMLETAEILNRATSKSLIIMDEVGRGTAVSTALAIAFATIHHLYSVNQCIGLFATHFHEVADLLGYREESKRADGYFKDISFFSTDVDELENGVFAYSHRLRPGVNRDSHGLKVARLGGMPESVMRMATLALKEFLGQEKAALIGRTGDLRELGKRLVADE